MNKLLLASALFLLSAVFSHAQSVRLPTGTSLPAACTKGDIFLKTSNGVDQKVHICTATNTWEQQGQCTTGVTTGSTDATCYTGANAGAKIIAAIADLPSSVGTVDARGLRGAQAINTNVSVPNNVTVLLGNGSNFTFSDSGKFTLAGGSALLCDGAFGIPSAPNLGCLFTNNTAALSPVVIANGAIGTIVENIGFDGSNRVTSLGPAIDFATGVSVTNRVYLRNISIINWKGHGILLRNNTQDIHFNNITASDVGEVAGSKATIKLTGTSNNSHQFNNVQIDSPYYAGIDINTSSGSVGSHLFNAIKIDTNAAPAGTHNIIYSGTSTLDSWGNLFLRADKEAAGTGDCIKIDAAVTSVFFGNGQCVRVEAPAGTGLNVNHASATAVYLNNFSFKGFTTGIIDIAATGLNRYTGIYFENNTSDTTFTNFQPISTFRTGVGSVTEEFEIRVKNLIKGSRSGDNDLPFQTKTAILGTFSFQDGGGTERATISGVDGTITSNADVVTKSQFRCARAGDNDCYIATKANNLGVIGLTDSDGTIKTQFSMVDGCIRVGLYDGTGLGPYICSGAGSPEGVVAVGPGSTWHNTSGGAGVSFYVKESGTGNTGWVAK